MRFRNFPETLLGSKVRVKILMYMLAEGAPTSERELSRILGVSHMAVSKSIKGLYELNLLMPFRIGNVISWRLNKKSYSYDALMDIENIMAKRPPLEDLRLVLKEKLSGRGLLMARIFGSVVDGRSEPDSDIDLLIVAPGRKHNEISDVVDELSDVCLQRYGNRLSAHILTERTTKERRYRAIVRGSDSGITVI